jgi:hypothetical protein
MTTFVALSGADVENLATHKGLVTGIYIDWSWRKQIIGTGFVKLGELKLRVTARLCGWSEGQGRFFW